MKRFLTYMLSLTCIISCTTAGLDSPVATGRITVRLEGDVPVKAQTKAPETLTPEQAAEYTIAIYTQDNELFAGPIDFVNVADALVVPLNASYYVTAENCTEAEAEIDVEGVYGCARYAGQSSVFEMSTSNISQDVNIYCSQSNALVTVQFDPSVAGRFTDLKVKLSSDANADRLVTVNESDGIVKAYFNPAELSYEISGTYTALSKQITLTGTRVLAQNDNIILSVKLDLTHGQAGLPSIVVSEEFVSEENADCEIDPYK